MISPIRCVLIALSTFSLLLLAAGAGVAQSPDRREPSTLLPLEPLWTAVLPASPAAAPLHQDGQVFLPLRDGKVVAVDALEGTTVWEVMQEVVGQPAIGGGRLYVSTGSSLRALETDTGEAVWEVAIDTPLSAPLVWNNGWLIAAVERQGLMALQAATGETIWRRALGGTAHVRPALAADRMYVSLDNGGLLALSLRSGELIWEQQLDGPPTEVLPLDDLFVGAADNHFYRLSRVDGAIKWRWRTGGDIIGRAAVDEQRVYFSSLDNVVWALDRVSGNQHWKQSLVARPTAGPEHADDLLVLAGLGLTLSFHDPEDGMLYGRVQAPTEVAFPPLVIPESAAGPVVVYVTGDGRLLGLARGVAPPLVDPATAPIFFKKAPATGASTDDDDDDDDDQSEAENLVSTLLPPPTLDGSPPPAPADPALPTGATTDAAGVASPAAAQPGGLALQVAALSSAEGANALVGRLVAAGYPAYVVEPGVGGTPAVYRVRLGGYPDRAAAEAVGREVEAAFELDWYVVTR